MIAIRNESTGGDSGFSACYRSPIGIAPGSHTCTLVSQTGTLCSGWPTTVILDVS